MTFTGKVPSSASAFSERAMQSPVISADSEVGSDAGSTGGSASIAESASFSFSTASAGMAMVPGVFI